ncbi:hypothetical protein Dsin_016155 [Dipteronia sinensis]|uniref:RNase H type-1 domain-containing protein n=1 Tax=Dipteronia sinensis TaxID=43782 RepID=A0AAE0ACN5_9ROSI|nr:hypothetical protein Dsin_016155 [Dipteronia sinensis]
MCSKLCLGRIPGYLLFAMTLWFTWKWKCDRVFDSTFQLSLCPGSIFAGGVIRDNTMNWLVGFALNKGLGSVIEAELWGIFEGLKLVWKVGFRKVIVESDSQSTVLLLSNTIPLNHLLFNIIHVCKSLMENEWSCTIHHVYRESNKAVDFLTNLSHYLDLEIIVFEEPPTQISGILDDDYNGVDVGRMISSS